MRKSIPWRTGLYQIKLSTLKNLFTLKICNTFAMEYLSILTDPFIPYDVFGLFTA